MFSIKKEPMMVVDRRDFLRWGLSTAAMAWAVRGGGRIASASDDPGDVPASEIPIVDTHVHLWDLDRLQLPWLKGNASLSRNHLISDYQEAAEGLNVVRAVYMEVDVEPSQHVDEAEYVIDLCRRGVGPLVGCVIGGRPAADDFGSYLDRFRDSPEVKGVRQVLHGASTPRGYCLAPEFQRGIRMLGERDLSFDLCMRAQELRDADSLVKACPETRFVLDHCGNPSVRSEDLSAWRDDLARLAERENVVCKVSGIVASAAPGPWTPDDLAPIVKHVLDSFGPDRVVFGGDWPVCTRAATLRQWVEALKTIVSDRSPADRRKLFHDNAIRVYHLPV